MKVLSITGFYEKRNRQASKMATKQEECGSLLISRRRPPDATLNRTEESQPAFSIVHRQIARFEDVTFDFCECVDLTTGQEVRHPIGGCRVPGVVIVKIIYTSEEAQQRKEEDQEVIEVFEKRKKQVLSGKIKG